MCVNENMWRESRKENRDGGRGSGGGDDGSLDIRRRVTGGSQTRIDGGRGGRNFGFRTRIMLSNLTISCDGITYFVIRFSLWGLMVIVSSSES